MLYYLGAFTSLSNPTCTETLCWTVLFAPIYDVATMMSPSGFKFLFWRLKEMDFTVTILLVVDLTVELHAHWLDYISSREDIQDNPLF